MMSSQLSSEELLKQNARLTDELATCKNEAEIASINYEQSAKAMEEHFAALSEEHEKLSASKELLAQEKEMLSKETTEAKATINKLQAQLVGKDLAIEENLASVEALHLEKRALDRRLEFSQEEVAEYERQLKLAQEKIAALSAEASRLDAEAQEAKAVQRRTELEKKQLNQVNENLVANSKWLEDSMSHLRESMKSERQKSTQEIMELQSKYQQADAKVQMLEQTTAQLRSKLEQKQRALEDAQGQLKAEQMTLIGKEEQFEKELSVAQKLASLHKSHSDKRTAEAAELESVVRDLRQHIEDLSAAHLTVTEKLEAAVADGDRRLAEEKEKLERMLQAAASGQFAPSTPQTPVLATHQTNGSPEPPVQSLSTAAHMSKTELYTLYTEATSSWKEERLRRRQNEIILEQLCAEIEKKAVLVREQQAEYERVQAAYAQMTASMDHAAHEKRHAEALVLDLKAQIRNDDKVKTALEQQIQDLSFQISVVLNEQQRGSSGGLRSGTPQRITSAGRENGSLKIVTASDAISQHLLSFADIQELQELNQRQTAIIRDLSTQQENAAAEMRADMEAEKERLQKKVELDITFNRRRREEQEELVQQIARQRDMFRKLLQDAAALPNRPGGATDLQLIASADAQLAGNLALQVAGSPDYQKLYADLDKELEKVKEDAGENAKLLREEASKAKEAASAARAERARSQADAAFEKQRSERQAEHAEELRLQVQQVTEHSAKYQGMMLSLQDRLSTSMAEAHQAQQSVTALERKLHALEVEKTLASNAEQRLAASISQLSSEKHALEADLRSERNKSGRADEDAASERARLNAELSKARQAEMDAVKELTEAQKRARDAAAAKDVIQMQAEDRIAKAAKSAEASQSSASEALQKAATLQGKAEVLQRALQKAEERAANLEFQRTTRSQAGTPVLPTEGGSPGAGSDGKLAGEVQLLKEQLMSAYEKAAEATSRIAQYQALAESSNQALEAMQADHEAFKAEANKRSSASQTECRELREQADAAGRELHELQQKYRNLVDSHREAADAQTADAAKSSEEVRRLQQVISDKDDQIANTKKDLEFWRQRFNAAEERAQREIIDHAATIKQLQTADAAIAKLEDKVNESLQAKLEAEAKQATAEEERKAKISHSEAAVAAAERRLSQIEQQNKILHEQLEKMSQQLPAAGDGSELTGVVSFLRQQLEVLEEEKALARHEADRLRGEVNVLKRTVDSLKAQLASEEDRQQRAAQEEALFRERRESQANFNMVKESNASLRLQNEELDRQVKGLKAELSTLTKLRRPLELEITRLKADVENKVAEIKLKAEEAAMWEKRVQQLLARYGKVDIEEYKRVEDQLKQLQASLKDTVPRKDLAQAEARIKEVEDIARKKVAQDYHNRTVNNLEQQLSAAKRAATGQDVQTKTEIARLQALVKEKTDQAAELEATKQQLEESNLRLGSKQKQMMNVYNPERIKAPEWKAKRNEEIQGFSQSKQYLATLQEFVPNGNGPEDLRAKLQTDSNKVSSLEQQIQEYARAAPETASLREGLDKCMKHGKELQQQIEASHQERNASLERLELSQTRQRQLEAKISELEDTVKSLSVTAPAPSIAEPTQGATTADATPAVTQPEALQTVEAAAAAEPQEIAAPASQELLVTAPQMVEPVPEAFPAVVSHDLQNTIAPPEEAPIVQAEETVVVEGLQPVQNQQPPMDYASVASIPQTSDPIPLQVISQPPIEVAPLLAAAEQSTEEPLTATSLPPEQDAAPMSLETGQPFTSQDMGSFAAPLQETAQTPLPVSAEVSQPVVTAHDPVSSQPPAVEAEPPVDPQPALPQSAAAASPPTAMDVMLSLRQQALQQRQRAATEPEEEAGAKTPASLAGEAAQKRSRPETTSIPPAKRIKPAEEQPDAGSTAASKDPAEGQSGAALQEMEGIDDTESGEEGGEGEGHEEEEEDDMPGLPHPEVESRTAPQDPSLPAAQTIDEQEDKDAPKERRSERQKKRTPIPAWTGNKKEAPAQQPDSSPPATRGAARGRGRTRGVGRGRRGPAAE